MAIIVNKEEKRRNIALACRELLLEHGIANLTIAQIAKTAGVGKGTIYEYFEHKEDIVFEIIHTFIDDHEAKLEEICCSAIHTRQKLFHILYALFENETARRHLALYKEFLAISLMYEHGNMIAFSQQCRERFFALTSEVLGQGRESGEIASDLVISERSIHLFAMGLVVDSRIPSLDVKEEIEIFLDMVLKESK